MDDTGATILAVFRRNLTEFPELQADDDVFDHGADSLIAERIMTELSGIIGQELPLFLLLDHPTARSLARSIPPPGEA